MVVVWVGKAPQGSAPHAGGFKLTYIKGWGPGPKGPGKAQGLSDHRAENREQGLRTKDRDCWVKI